MLNFLKTAKCGVCQKNKLPKSPAILFVEDKEGKREVELCDECAAVYEELAKDGEDHEDDESV